MRVTAGFIAFRLPGMAVEMFDAHMMLSRPAAGVRHFIVNSFGNRKHDFFCVLDKPTKTFHGGFYRSGIPEPQADKDYFTQTVSAAVENIKASDFEKVVLSRNKHQAIAVDFDLEKAFLALCEKFPDCFVCLVSTAETGTWLGASPELLFRKTGKKLESYSLAGTKQVADKSDWGEKEKEEQKIVTRYIAEVFKKHNLTAVHSLQSTSIRMGELAHLVTHFEANESYDFGEQQFLADLSPTPAVCGFPKDAAMNFIQQNEGYQRQFYSGYWGIQSDAETNLYVNLRCMQLYKDKAVLYAGAGITADSDPEKEWLETEAKMKLLGDLLFE